MTDQLRISDSGEIEAQPLTWDGEPIYSPSTVREGLFDAEAFEQLPGQIAMGDACENCENCGGPAGYPSDHAVGCPRGPIMRMDHRFIEADRRAARRMDEARRDES